jgi:flagellar hook-associated protein 1 FlgK
VGTRTRQAEITSAAQEKLLSDAIATRESISGVNLDEEAANLLRYQQAYQAAAQVIATADTLFKHYSQRSGDSYGRPRINIGAIQAGC